MQVQVRVSVSEVRTGTEALRSGKTWFRVSGTCEAFPALEASAASGKRGAGFARGPGTSNKWRPR